MRYELGIYQTYWWGLHITEIYQVYAKYIPCMYWLGSDIPAIYQEYSWYILYGLSSVYTCIYQVYIYITYMLSIYIVYTWHLYSISLGYTMHMLCIYIVYTQYIMCIYSTRWLVLRGRAGSHSTGSTSNHIWVAWTSHKFYFAGARNKMSYQEYTRYIKGILKVYTKCRPVDRLLNPVAGLAPRLFIVQLPYNWAFALHLPASVPCFPGIYLL